MGQYYNALLAKKGAKNFTAIFPSQTGDARKLMEFAWIGGSFMNTVMHKLWGNPHRLAFVGDYVLDGEWGKEPFQKNIEKTIGMEAFENCFGDIETCKDLKEAIACNVNNSHWFILNHTKGVYISMTGHIKLNKAEDDYAVIHPLALLCACGNGRGGGDYHGINEHLVGTWAFDEISVSDKFPKGMEAYYVEFREEY